MKINFYLLVFKWNLIECSDLVISESVELTFEMELGCFSIGFLTNDVYELTIFEVHFVVFADVPFEVFLVCPVPIIILHRNEPLLWMLFHFLIVPVSSLIISCSWKHFIHIVETGTHKRNAIRNVVK